MHFIGKTAIIYYEKIQRPDQGVFHDPIKGTGGKQQGNGVQRFAGHSSIEGMAKWHLKIAVLVSGRTTSGLRVHEPSGIPPGMAGPGGVLGVCEPSANPSPSWTLRPTRRRRPAGANESGGP